MDLKDLNNRNVFKTPENYFEELPSRVQDRIVSERKTSVLTPVIWKLAIPAVMVILAFFLWPSQEITEPTFDSTEILAYLEESNIFASEIIEEFEVDSEMLADLITDEVSFDETSIENELEWSELETLIIE